MSLKETYNLSYDLSGFNSGLINWYNRLIDKQYEMLNIEDVAKMIRQDVLKEVAIKRAIDLFFVDPYDGEYEDGGLLNLLVSLEFNKIDESILQKLNHQLEVLQTAYLEFEWEEEELKEKYRKNMDEMLKK
ncbi:MAG: contact-dependent growth inhibition system immunity protein [Defluviitaleaceae bacterium]|nr:contact-dependent growth inhibition system immunity protein [Defluviitaleaceae bacterium]